jgi:hypothetical protein
MADPKQLASLLSEEEELRRFNAMQGDQPWYSKALPMEGRATFLPFRDTMEGSVFNKREVALPGILAGALNAFTSPARALTGSDPTFKPGEEAANMALNTFGGGIATGKALTNPTGIGGKDLALNVYHGTPHEIAGNKFDISKVGTGEGAQSYGHGIYVAENPSVGKEYQKMLAGPDQTAADYLKMYKTPENAISVLEGSITPNLTPEAKQFTQAAIDALKSGKSLIGNFYKADLPDAQIPKMLDWDQPIAKQAPEILALLKNHPVILEDVAKGKTLEQLSGGDAYKAIASSFDVGQKEAYKLASEYLASRGIPGIKYLDQQSRTSNLSSSTRTQLDAKIETLQKDIASGLGNQELMKRQLANLEHERNQLPKATSNFVSFKPETLEILEKNNVPVSRKELLRQEFDKLDK